jgi:hypothetical protein
MAENCTFMDRFMNKYIYMNFEEADDDGWISFMNNKLNCKKNVYNNKMVLMFIKC